MDTLAEAQLAGGGLEDKKSSRRRNMCLSDFLHKSSDKNFHPDPLAYFDEDTDSGEVLTQNGTSARPSPLRQFGTVVGSLLGIQYKNGEKKPGANRSQRLDLLEFAQRQQDDIAVKQDTIELLEWKVEQLQAVILSPATVQPYPRKTPSPMRNDSRHGKFTGILELQSNLPGRPPRYSASPLRFHKCLATTTDSSERSEGCSKCHTDAEVAGRYCPHGHFCNSPGRDPNVEAKLTEKAVFESAILHLFGMTAVKARVAVRYFCKNFMKQMEVSGYSVLRTLAEVDRRTKFSRKEHAAFSLESRVNRAMYRSFENDSFDEAGITRIINPEKRCMIRLREYQRLKLVEAADAVNPEHEDYDKDFGMFSEKKLREIWFLFPWNIIFPDSHEKSAFNAAFLEAAKCVWQIHKLAFSVDPPVTILRVEKGMHANTQYVEQVTPVDEQCMRCEGPKIEFMTMPGFQTRKKTIKCQVYRHVQCV